MKKFFLFLINLLLLNSLFAQKQVDVKNPFEFYHLDDSISILFKSYAAKFPERKVFQMSFWTENDGLECEKHIAFTPIENLSEVLVFPSSFCCLIDGKILLVSTGVESFLKYDSYFYTYLIKTIKSLVVNDIEIIQYDPIKYKYIINPTSLGNDTLGVEYVFKNNILVETKQWVCCKGVPSRFKKDMLVY